MEDRKPSNALPAAASVRTDRLAASPLAAGTMDKLLRLAAFRLAAEEQRALEQELAMIIERIDVMRDVDTAGVEPLAHPLEVAQPLRADVVVEEPDRDRLQRGAPAVRDGLYLVPRVVE